MSHPSEPDPVKLIASLFSPEKEMLDRAAADMEVLFGPVDWRSPELYFDRTRYYEREMGWPLHRCFVSFERLVPADRLAEIKLETNRVEERYLEDGRRRVNIDPGLISAERLVLATGKNYVHRIYLSKGIYADLTLLYKRKCFRSLPWTYPDYGSPETVAAFNGIRERYMNQLREMKQIA